jgi:hypothetical protein
MNRDARFLRQPPKLRPLATARPVQEVHLSFGGRMAMDAKRCRDNVNRCIELAKDAKDAETRLILFELVKGWLEAAAKLEKIKPSAKDMEIVTKAGRAIKKVVGGICV